MIELTIDDLPVSVPEGTSILDAARSVEIDIPTLCYERTLGVIGACRLCTVEIEDGGALRAACATAAAEGMVVHTESDAVVETRRTLLDLLLSDHPLDCIVCEQAGGCKLQEYCYRYDVGETSYPGERALGHIDDENHLIQRDQNKCILCGKCVVVCQNVQVTNTIDFAQRGFEARVDTSFEKPLSLENCVFCGQCVDLCPTGALTNKQLKGTRTWERKKVRTTCPFCGVGCNFDLNVADGKIVGVTAAYDAPVNQGSLCVKGRFHTDLITNPERITRPLIKRNGVFGEATWDEALDLVACRLKETQAEHGAMAVGVLSSARCTNEENYLLQRLTRAGLNNNNIDHCART
jgi:NADH-quinone oxidoreductase subunit G